MKEGFEIVERAPSASDYTRLRRAVKWEDVDTDAVNIGLAGALHSVCLLHNGEVIGCGRVVGDGAIYMYLQDIIVLPEYQGQGLGREIMARVMKYVSAHARENTFVGLMAAAGVETLYEKYGFTRRPSDRPGMYRMWKEKQKGLSSS